MNFNSFCYCTLRMILKPIFQLLYRPKCVGTEHIPISGRVILAGNHMHALDPILVDVSTQRVVRTLAKKDLHDGAFGFLFRAVGTIPVDLHSSENKAARNAAVAALEQEYAVNISPEAKRNYTNELLLPFKYGAVSMAAKTGAPIVPYAITGEYRLFSRSITITFGEPIPAEKDLYTANALLYHRIAALLQEQTDAMVLQKKHFTSFAQWEANK